MDKIYDLLVIGAGVNGAGIARDAAGRGLTVALVDKGDVGGATSSASTKLLHGGLRYLEFYDFRLVRKALQERERLLGLLPHISWPLSFVLPHQASMRPKWKIRLGLFLYDHLARRTQVPASSSVRLRSDSAGQPLKAEYLSGFRYWDGWVDDSRLVIANARDAAARGADIFLHQQVITADYRAPHWHVRLGDGRALMARHVANCAGPWADHVARDILQLSDAPNLRLVQGAHIIVRRIGSGKDAYMLQQPDGRIIFMIPYEGQYTLIGTTETPVDSPTDVHMREAERDYLLEAVNRYLQRPLTSADIVHHYAGVRPLVMENEKDARETTRDWRLVHHADLPATTVVGGKITTYRRLAEQMVNQLAPDRPGWTDDVPLPGGDVPRDKGESGQAAFARWCADLALRHPLYDRALLTRLTRLYGTETEAMLENGLGAKIGGLFEAEMRHMVDKEWARTAEDILWRRTKMGLHLSRDDQQAIGLWLADQALG